MSIQHRILPDSELHEPKGAASAIGGTLYVSDGTGSGAWQKIPATSLQGISTASVADRFVVTDGTGGLKTVAGSAYGQIYYNVSGSSAVSHSTVSYLSSFTNNVAQNGTHLQVLVSGMYHLTFSADGYDDPNGTTVPMNTRNVFITIDGANPVGVVWRGGSNRIWCEAIVPMVATGETWVSGDFFTHNGSLTAVYLG